MTILKRQICLRSSAAGWWLNVLVSFFFAFYIHYVPIHLATEIHITEALPAQVSAAQGLAGIQSEDHDLDHHQHLPHFASEHVLRLVAQAPTVLLLLDFAPVEAGVLLPSAQPNFVLFLTERQNPPGQAVSAPSQPRAPPIV